MGVLPVQLRKRTALSFTAQLPEQGQWGGALVHKAVRHGAVVQDIREGVQMLGVWLPDAFLLNAPDDEQVGAEMLGSLFAAHAHGDWNQEAADTVLGPLC